MKLNEIKAFFVYLHIQKNKAFFRREKNKELFGRGVVVKTNLFRGLFVTKLKN